MKKPEKTKSDPLGWILAFIFPKKGKPLPQTQQTAGAIAKPAQPATPAATAPASAPSQPVEAVKPFGQTAAPPIHAVSAPPSQPAPSKPIAKPITAPAPAGGQSQLTRLSKSSDKTTEKKNFMPTIWTVGSILSLVVNVILIIVLIVLANQLFVLKAMVGDQLLGGLYENFILMDLAHIKTEITVKDNIPINFTLPISQDTVVTLTQNTPINGANVRINSGGLTINSAANIVLPAGTSLPVHLQLDVPVNTTVPITIKVPVDIPLQQTELHKPFIGLQQVVDPFYKMLLPNYKKASDVPLCKPFAGFCNLFFANP